MDAKRFLDPCRRFSPSPRARIALTLGAFWRAVFAGSTFLAAAASANPIEKLQPNQPPETVLASGPSDSTDATVYRVQFFWSGTDPDGRVDHFEFIMVDHPRIQDHISGGLPDDPTRVTVTVPEPDDPRWTATFATDSTFVTLADTLRRDPRPGPGEDPEAVRRQPFERWHTFFIRAVDDGGLPDPTPDYRSFNSKTIAPRLWLLPPVKENQVFLGPPVIVFNWEGEDEVGDGTFREPVASRWVNITSRVTVNGTPENGGYLSFPDSLYDLPERFHWSDWNRWDAADGSGKSAVVKNLFSVGEFPDSGYYIFAAQAMDEAGAVTPVFDWKTPGKNNVALVRVSGPSGPNLIVEEEFLGRFSLVNGSRPLQIDIAAGQPINFRWIGDAFPYGGRIVAYRYGWDIRNPDNDEEWEQNWCDTCPTKAPTRSFTAGTHRFFLQVRDNAESITSAEFELIVHPVTLERDLLWVDDTEFTTPDESGEDARWLAVLNELAAANGLQFDPGQDVFDSAANFHEPPPLSLVFDHKVVVWSNRAGPTRTSALRALCQFVDPFAPRYRNTAKSYNYVLSYLASAGRLWINGYRPAAKALWPQERPVGQGLGPVNVTNWDDPIEPHPPGVDSVGTGSLLYRMGVEMFDVGGGIDTENRTPLAYFCQGLRTARAGAPELQVDLDVWPEPLAQPTGLHGRSNIEIYNMPRAMEEQFPPLAPQPGISTVVYTYITAPTVMEDPAVPRFYPQTSDRQPVFLLAKGSPGDPYFSRAFCGFEPRLLTFPSHLELTRYVLREFGIIPTPVFLQEFVAHFAEGSVRIRWRLGDSSDPAEFVLRANQETREWTVPHTALDGYEFTAIDNSLQLALGGTATYSLYCREAGADWILLGQEKVTLSKVPVVTQLLAPRPNPFNPSAVIPFVLETSQRVRFTVYDLEGRTVTRLLDAVRPPGPGSVIWDGTDGAGRPVASGVYLVRMEAGGPLMSRRLVLIR